MTLRYMIIIQLKPSDTQNIVNAPRGEEKTQYDRRPTISTTADFSWKIKPVRKQWRDIQCQEKFCQRKILDPAHTAFKN